MTSSTHFIGIYDDLEIPLNYCNEMISEFQILSNNKENVEINNNGNKRTDNAVYLSTKEGEFLARLTHKILQQAIDKYIVKHPALALLKFSANCVKIQKTMPSGGFHNWHTERSPHVLVSKSRVLVWTIYLNDIPRGEGEIEFLELGVKVHPKAGRVVLFPADWCHEHRGNPVYRTTKYIATGWYHESEI